MKMYIGPSIHGVVQRNDIFKDTLPERIKERAAGDSYFSRLLVDIEDVPAAKKQLKEEGSVLAVSFYKVAKSRE